MSSPESQLEGTRGTMKPLSVNGKVWQEGYAQLEALGSLNFGFVLFGASNVVVNQQLDLVGFVFVRAREGNSAGIGAVGIGNGSDGR
jgi:hypothetical protein